VELSSTHRQRGYSNTGRQKCRVKGSGKEVKIQESRYRGTTNVEREMYDYTIYSWSHWNSNERSKEKSRSYTRETFDRFTEINILTKGSVGLLSI
jgi:hypothetical protein